MSQQTETKGATIEIEVLRYQPEIDEKPHFQSYTIPYDESWSILQALQHIKDHLDGTLSFRWSCRMAICGSCGMMVGGTPHLACKTFLRDYYPGKVTVAPLDNFPIERDLIPEIGDFIEKLKAIKPYIISSQENKPLTERFKQTPRQLTAFRNYTLCINCLLCYAACPEYKVKPHYVGPAALSLLHRYNMDNRDEGYDERIGIASSEDGAWGCTAVGLCSQVCPKHVDPAGAVQQLKASVAKDYMLSFFKPAKKSTGAAS
jgi:fumarate reductase iron-sulfur subunit